MKAVEERAYDQGRSAARKGKPRHDNPYHCATSAGAIKYRAWFRGFDEATIDAALTAPDRREGTT